MPLGFSQIFFHIVWRIASTSPKMSIPTCRIVEDYLERQGERFGYEPIAVSVIEDHVHILAKVMPGVTPGLLVETFKEELNQYLKKNLAMKNAPIWDDGYGILTISPSHIEAIVKYIKQQQLRHNSGKINATLERVRS